MIIIISKKDFEKNAKKLAEKKEYLICDGTDGTSGTFAKYSHVVTMDGFVMPNKLVKSRLSDKMDREIDPDKLKTMEKKFFKGKSFKTVVMACIKDIVTTDDGHNIFVVIDNKPYKAYAKKIVKNIHKIVGVDFDFAFLFDDVKGNKSILKSSLKNGKIKDLSKTIKKFEDKNS